MCIRDRIQVPTFTREVAAATAPVIATLSHQPWIDPSACRQSSSSGIQTVSNPIASARRASSRISTPRWVEIRELALRAEAMGVDTVWIPDELLWRQADGSIHGWWESVAMTGAVAAATSRVKVGTWILSALHRNPAITAKAVATLDEI